MRAAIVTERCLGDKTREWHFRSFSIEFRDETRDGPNSAFSFRLTATDVGVAMKHRNSILFQKRERRRARRQDGVVARYRPRKSTEAMAHLGQAAERLGVGSGGRDRREDEARTSVDGEEKVAPISGGRAPDAIEWTSVVDDHNGAGFRRNLLAIILLPAFRKRVKNA